MFKDPRTPCFMCKINDDCLHCLQRLEQITRQVEPKKNWGLQWRWDINMRCKYGIGNCHEIHQIKNECNRLIQKVEPRLVTIAEEDDEYILRNTMMLLRGNFPTTYSEMARLKNKYKN